MPSQAPAAKTRCPPDAMHATPDIASPETDVRRDILSTIEQPVEVDGEKLMQFVFRAVDEVGATLNTALVVMGDRLGLYQALAGAGPLAGVAYRGPAHRNAMDGSDHLFQGDERAVGLHAVRPLGRRATRTVAGGDGSGARESEDGLVSTAILD